MRIDVRPLQQSELPAADRIFRVAFGTHWGLETPESFAAGSDYIRTRWSADPFSALAALVDGQLVGTSFVVRWGSFGYFGPLSVMPSYWNGGIGGRLVEATVDLLEQWRVQLAGLYTFSDSVKHARLYERFGFRRRGLTRLWIKSVSDRSAWSDAESGTLVSQTDAMEGIESCRRIADRIFAGLDLTREVRSVLEQGLGEVLLLSEAGRPAAFGVCHLGEGTEAGPGVAYIKFAAALSESAFRSLLGGFERLAGERGLGRLLLGVNLSRGRACRVVAESGFAPRSEGVAMHRPNVAGFSHENAWVIDDWR